MILIQWNNPLVSISDLEIFLRNCIGDSNYDGVVLNDTKLYINTYEPLSIEQEDYIRDYIATVNDQPRLVSLTSPKDSDNRPLFRQVITHTEFNYTPRSLDFYTSKLESLYNRSHYGDGTIDGSIDLGDAGLLYYDADNDALTQGESESDGDFQIRLTANCTKTVMWFEPTFNYDVIGAKLQFRDIPSDRAYFWFVAAPDIPAEYGGNVVFMGGGMNIAFFNEKETFECDGKSVSTIAYDGTYHSGKVALIVKHNVGVQIGVQLIYQFYSG